MAAPLNKVGKVVDAAGEVRDGAQLVLRPGTTTALIRYHGSEVLTRDDAVNWTSEAVGRLTTYTVHFANGDQWTVTPTPRGGGCRTCGGSR